MSTVIDINFHSYRYALSIVKDIHCQSFGALLCYRQRQHDAHERSKSAIIYIYISISSSQTSRDIKTKRLTKKLAK
jgi:2-oxoglutarate dehydrogenase complex dehydrogenase (E1) component-like enzyme